MLSLSQLIIGITLSYSNMPHLIFVMVDDWGWFEAGFRGNALAQTPFVDKLAAEDALLIERHYGYKFCSPARRSFLTGRLPPHVGQTNVPDAAIDLRMKTIAEKLAAKGYVTGHSGKWHAGFFSMKQTPHGRGFSTSLGFLYGVDHWTQQSFEKVCKYGHGGNSTDLWATDRPARGRNGTYGDFMYVGHAVETIMQHNTSTPLFYYLATEVAHFPNEAPRRFCDKFDHETVPFDPVYAMSSVVDESLSNVTAALRAKGMWQNTLMVIASDNGGPLTQTHASNFPLRGGKMSWLEGGIRTTALVTGGLLPPGMRGTNLSSAHLIAMCDWHSTFLALAGDDGVEGGSADGKKRPLVPVPGIDGVDQWPVISGVSSIPLRSEVFIGSGVLIQANLKLIAATSADVDTQWTGPMFPKVPATGGGNSSKLSCSEQKPCLFDVVADYREQRDLASTRPNVVAKMQARLATLMEGVFEADPVPNATQAKVCEASVANGMWITPYDWPSLPPTPPLMPTPPPGPRPPSPAPLPGDEWLAFPHQWLASSSAGEGYTLTALQDRAVLKKSCANSKELPANETHFFDTGHVVALSARQKNTSICGASLYYEVQTCLTTALAGEDEDEKVDFDAGIAR